MSRVWLITGASRGLGKAFAEVALEAGEYVICDYYFVPEDLSGRTPTPMPTAVPGNPVTGLPSTGDGEAAGSDSVLPMLVAGAGVLLVGAAGAATLRKR